MPGGIHFASIFSWEDVYKRQKLGRAEFQKVVPISKLKSVTETEEQLEA